MNFTLRHARTCERRVPWQFMQLLSVGDVDFPISLQPLVYQSIRGE